MPESVDEYHFRLSISREQALRYYRGAALAVQAVSDDGRRVRFPAGILRPFITALGVHGRFRLRVDAHNRVVDLQRLGD